MKNKQVSLINLKVTYGYDQKRERVTNMFTGREKIENVPTGKYHIFELLKVDGVYKSSPFTMCGISHAQIGENNIENESRPHGIPICPVCEKAWKEDPRSPWKAFVSGKGIKVA